MVFMAGERNQPAGEGWGLLPFISAGHRQGGSSFSSALHKTAEKKKKKSSQIITSIAIYCSNFILPASSWLRTFVCGAGVQSCPGLDLFSSKDGLVHLLKGNFIKL